ncbi:MAG: hypothetical protein CSB06_02310 [Bacteroidia bacterium]|nr:MAG: hypothetical protein CSB06_02310 [Bacteroidia bacterium]
MKYKEIETQEQLQNLLEAEESKICFAAFQNLDLSPWADAVLQKEWQECIFLGCRMNEKIQYYISDKNYIFPALNLPYNMYPANLYSAGQLYDKYVLGNPETYENTFDKCVYNHFLATGKEAESISESLARSLHDHSITDAMYDFLANYEEKKVLAVMGGHGLSRQSEDYKQIARLSKQLTEENYLMTSGGGPGAMEATHLGAWFAGSSEKDLTEAFRILEQAPNYKHKNWLEQALKVTEMFPLRKPYESLGIPTWFYGHEPPTPFATKIAKFFANSIREDLLLSIAKGGIIFSPGSAGTLQEIFQEVTQNHYLSFGFSSPMIFINQQFWKQDFPAFSFLQSMQQSGKLKNLKLACHDDIQAIIKELKNTVWD